MSFRESNVTDARLISGDAHGFAMFYRRHEEAVLMYFLRRTRNAELAADLTAETFARALEGRRRYDAARGDVSAWLFGIARNTLGSSVRKGCVDNTVRARLRMEPLDLDDAIIARINELDDPRALVALESLPQEQRDAIVGRIVHEETYNELAKRLCCSESVVRQRVSRGLRQLRKRVAS